MIVLKLYLLYLTMQQQIFNKYFKISFFISNRILAERKLHLIKLIEQGIMNCEMYKVYIVYKTVQWVIQNIGEGYML